MNLQMPLKVTNRYCNVALGVLFDQCVGLSFFLHVGYTRVTVAVCAYFWCSGISKHGNLLSINTHLR